MILRMTGKRANFFLHTGYGYPYVLPGPTILISSMLSHTGPDKTRVFKELVEQEVTYLRRQVNLVFTADDVIKT